MENKTPTPHIEAKFGEIAETVIMAGDPLRAKLMAERFLENPVQYNNVRGMLGFTGTYKGKRVSVQGHGMGIPSISIYAHELICDYHAKKLIRVGTCGGLKDDVHVRDFPPASRQRDAHARTDSGRDSGGGKFLPEGSGNVPDPAPVETLPHLHHPRDRDSLEQF